jgi:hypothetical protein
MYSGVSLSEFSFDLVFYSGSGWSDDALVGVIID